MSFLQISQDVTCCPHILQLNEAGGRVEEEERVSGESGSKRSVKGHEIIERGRGED